MNKKLTAATFAATAGLAITTFAHPFFAADADLQKVRVAVMTNGTSHWYAVIGAAEGIFEKHGIEVLMTEFGAGVNTVDAVVTGQADFGNLADYAAVNRIGSTQDKTNLVIVDRLSSSEGSAYGGLYVSEDINSLEDLAGKAFVTQAGTVWDYWVAKTYEEAGIAEEDQNIVSVDSPASATTVMITGDADAYWASGNNAAKLEEAGLKKLLTLSDLDLYTDAYYISTSEYVEANPELTEAFIEAQKETAEWIAENPEQAAKDFSAASGESEEQFLNDLEANILTYDFTQEGLDHLTGIKDWAVSEGRFEDYNILDFTNLDAVKAVNPDGVTIE